MRAHLKILVGAALVAAMGIPTLASARVERIPQRDARRDATVTTDVARPAVNTRLAPTATIGAPSVLADQRDEVVIIHRDNGLVLACHTVIGADGLGDQTALATTPKRPVAEALTPTPDELAMSPVPAVRNLRAQMFVFDAQAGDR